MKRQVNFLTLLLFISGISCVNAYASTDPGDSLKTHETVNEPPDAEVIQSLLNTKLAELNVPYGGMIDPIVIEDFEDDSTKLKRRHARTLKERVMNKKRFREKIDNSALVDLPIGVVGDRGGVEYAILLDRIFFNDKGAFLEVYMSFEMPQFGKPLDFKGVCQLTSEGGIVGTPRLYLIGDYPFDIGQGKLTIKGDERMHGGNSLTFVEFDCNGFKGVSLNAVVEFSKDLIVAESTDGTPLDERVKFDLATYITDWNDLLVRINLPAFQIKGVKGFGFQANEVYLDWSDHAGPPGFSVPADYQNPFTASIEANLWRGIFIKRADVRFPPQFKEQDDPLRRGIAVENLILDELGVSGNFLAENLIRTGDLSGWGYSIDRATVKIQQNSVIDFSLAGKVNVPVFEQTAGKESDAENPSLLYTAHLAANGDYVFDVKLAESLPLNFLYADLKLKPNSEFLLKVVNNDFQATVKLNGEMSIHAPIGNKHADINQISFENLVISNQKPYFRGGVFSFGSKSGSDNHHISGYPLTLDQIGLRTDQARPERVGLQLGVKINLVPSEDEGFSGSTTFTVWGNAPSEYASPETGTRTKQKWKPEKLEVDKVSIDIVKKDVFELKGSVQFFEGNDLFGNGFKGRLGGKLWNVQVDTEALFGRNEKVRYWNASALVCLGNGMPLIPGLALYGFGGGVYYRMKPAENPSSANSIGLSSSGVTYVPDEKALLGVKASVFFGTQNNPKPFNGDATFEILVNKTGGINSISFIGNAYFMSPNFSCDPQAMVTMAKSTITKGSTIAPATTKRAQVMGQIKLLYDNENSTLHGNIAIYVNAAGGIVTGTGPNKKAGWVELHFAPDEWYVLIGTPSAPIGLEVAKIAKLQSYFMMGMNIPSSPPPPDNVLSILKGVDFDYTRDMPSLEGGRAYAFGASYSVDTGDLQFLMFYGRFAAGAGFDLMLRDYGHSSHCSGSTEPLGINGWYANGQAYAYVEGKIGIRVRLKFYKDDYDILKIGAAAVLQAKGPNPFWMKGVVGGNYSILGGLVKGSCQFEVTVGKPCEIIIKDEDPLDDVMIIGDVSPVKNEKGVNVFTAPQAAFNIPVEKVFEITDASNVKHSFRAKLEEFSVKKGSTIIPGQLIWNSNNDVVAFDSYDILPSFSSMTLKVKVSFEELINGIWQKYKVDGRFVEETVESVFETGEAPDFIPESNVSYAYPIHGQQNFYPKEYSTGFVKLIKGQPELFQSKPEWTQKGRFISQEGNATEFDFTYNNTDKKVSFTIPNLPPSTPLQFQLVKKPNSKTEAVDKNVSMNEKDISTTAEIETTVTTKDIDGKLDLGEDKILYGATIRTSMYNTLTEKLNTIPVLYGFNVLGGPLSAPRLYSDIGLSEGLDALELTGSISLKPLVLFEAKLESTSWYNNSIYPLVYEGYPLAGAFTIKHRSDLTILGVPPVRSIFIEEYEGGATIQRSIAYSIYEAVKADFVDLQTQIANHVARVGHYSNKRYKDFVETAYPPSYTSGDYPVNIRYVIPGVGQTSLSEKNIKWNIVVK